MTGDTLLMLNSDLTLEPTLGADMARRPATSTISPSWPQASLTPVG